MPHVEVPSAEFKVVLLGDTNTGKTCLVYRLVEGSFKPSGRASTVGAFFVTKRLTVHNITCKMLLWDTAGPEQFQRLARTYYQHAAAAIVCFDVSNPRSLQRLSQTLDELQRYAQTNNPMVLTIAACKCDQPAVPGVEEEAQRLAHVHETLYIRTSARSQQGVSDLFQQTAARVLEWHELAVAGQARPLPVSVGSQTLEKRGERLSPMKALRSISTGFKPEPATRYSTSSPTNLPSYSFSHTTSPPIELVKPHSNGMNHHNYHHSNGISNGHHHHPQVMDQDSNDTTQPESDDVVLDPSNSSSAQSRTETCEGTYLVCGSDVGRGGCILM